MGYVIGILIGFVLGLVCWFALSRRRRADDKQMEDTFASLSQKALQANAEHVIQLARQQLAAQGEASKKELEGDKKLIDEKLRTVGEQLGKLRTFVQEADTRREGSHKALTAHLQTAAEETVKLQQTAQQLATALASPQHRGQWGERMAEDVLRLAGFIEGVNYHKQQSEPGGTRPDFTFPLPNGLKLNMDVKFPLANYVHYLDAGSDAERAEYGKAFINDVKSRIKEAATRDYINTAENTVNYALVFIPNEQVYGAIHELDPSAIDTALQSRIVLCSPLTLYAMLAVIRQAAENVAMEKKADEMADQINAFLKQWEKFSEELARLGSQLETVQKTYGRLDTTRSNQLEKPIDKIRELRSSTEPEMLEEET